MRRLRMTTGLLAATLLATLLPIASVSADDPATSTTTLSGPASVEEGTSVTLTAMVVAPDGYDADAATIAFHAISGGGADCAAAPVDVAGNDCDLGTLPEGSYTYEATYSGNAATLGSTSDPFSFEVTAAPPPDPSPSTTDLGDPGPFTVGDTFGLTATVTAPAGYETDATITFHDIAGDNGHDCTEVPVDTGGTSCDLSGLIAGTYTYKATYSGNATTEGSSDQVTFEVDDPPPGPSSSITTLTAPSTVLVGSDAILTANVSAPAGYETGATIDFTPISGGGEPCDDVAVDTAGTTCTLNGLVPGTYVYEATYSGNGTTLGSTSQQVSFDVTDLPDTTLDASGVGTDVTTFYPVKDGYRDTLKVKGVRNEPTTVLIRIYKPTGTRILSTTLAMAAGAYTYSWSGRDSHGDVRAAGKYKVVQTLRDGAGNALVVTKYVTLSHKKLVTKTKYVTKKGLSITAASVGNIFVSKSLGYAKLKGTSSNPARAGYAFTIPSAIVYKSISFQIYGTGPTTSPLSKIGLQNWSWPGCEDPSGDWAYWCFDHMKSWSGKSSAWHATSGSVTTNRRGTKGRGMIESSHGTVVVKKVRVKVVYRVLE